MGEIAEIIITGHIHKHTHTLTSFLTNALHGPNNLDNTASWTDVAFSTAPSTTLECSHTGPATVQVCISDILMLPQWITQTYGQLNVNIAL